MKKIVIYTVTILSFCALLQSEEASFDERAAQPTRQQSSETYDRQRNDRKAELAAQQVETSTPIESAINERDITLQKKQPTQRKLKSLNRQTQAFHETITESLTSLNQLEDDFDKIDKLINIPGKNKLLTQDKLQKLLKDRAWEPQQERDKSNELDTHLAKQERQKYNNLEEAVRVVSTREFQRAHTLVEDLTTSSNNKADLSSPSIKKVTNTLETAETITEKMFDLIEKTKNQTLQKTDLKEISKLLKKHFASLSDIAESHPNLHDSMQELHTWSEQAVEQLKYSYQALQEKESQAASEDVSRDFETWMQQDPTHVTDKWYDNEQKTALEQAVSDNNETMMQATVQAAHKHNISLKDLVSPLKKELKIAKTKQDNESVTKIQNAIRKVTTMYSEFAL